MTDIFSKLKSAADEGRAKYQRNQRTVEMIIELERIRAELAQRDREKAADTWVQVFLPGLIRDAASEGQSAVTVTREQYYACKRAGLTIRAFRGKHAFDSETYEVVIP